jgi:hypothetical protein
MPSSLDLDGDGVISLSEARAATNLVLTLRRGFFIALAMLGVQQVMMFGTVYWATQLASEVHVRNSELQDNEGRSVSTLSRRDKIDGLHYPEEGRRLNTAARRLNETGYTANDSENVSGANATDSGSDIEDLSIINESMSSEYGFHGLMEISQGFFQSTWHGYMSGESDWVVPFPDGSVRTVFIQGMSATFAWGICGACPGGNVQWEAWCPAEEDSNECSVVYHESLASSRLRRLAVEGTATPESSLLARARARRQEEGDAADTEGMERSLGGKHCA